MEIVEHVLKMGTGYVLDFSNQTFDEFIAHEAGIDATAPRFSADGGSKARRFRRVLHSLPSDRQASLLRSLLDYRDHPARRESIGILDDEWRDSFNQIISDLEGRAKVKQTHASSAWTGRRTIGEQVAVVRGLAPLAIQELDNLANLVEAKRFNDPITADAVQCLRELHIQIGDLLSTIDRGNITRTAVEAIEANRDRLLQLSKEGAKLALVAPTMTYGVIHLLSWITGVPIDSTMTSAVFGTIVGADALKGIGKKSSIADGK